MGSSEIYKNKFEEILRIEEKARDFYKYYLKQLKDPALLEKFQEIYKDEQRHVEIVQGFIDRIST
jgi:rubrerythrin